MEKLKLLEKYIEKPFVLLIFFIFCLTSINYLYCIIYTSDNFNFHLVDNDGNYILERISFGFGQYLDAIINSKDLTLSRFGIDLPTSRRPLLPYTILFIFKYLSSNFILLHLIKNLFFGLIIYSIIKNFKANYNHLFLAICLMLIFYNPHNAFTNLGTENEEGILNYLMIILFFLLISEYKYKSIYLTITLCLIFLLKGSMFLMASLLPIIFIFLEKKSKFKYLSLITIILLNLIWSYNAKQTSGFFAIGPKGSAMNSINLAAGTHKYFNTTYPKIRPDIHLDLVKKIVIKKNIKTERELINNLLSKSIKFIKDNPLDYSIGVLKKIYVLNFSPFKDGQLPKDPKKYLDNMYKGKLELNEKINNPIRLSNIPNKIIFNVSLILLLISLINFKKNSKYLNKLNLYYLSTLVFYLAPYMFAWIYHRHATSIYMIAHFYIMLYLIEKKIFSFNKIFLKVN